MQAVESTAQLALVVSEPVHSSPLSVQVANETSSDAGGRRAAIAYTILGSCRLAGVNPVEYLTDVLPRLARGVRHAGVAKWLPARVARPASSRERRRSE